jgi:hypothetical protein
MRRRVAALRGAITATLWAGLVLASLAILQASERSYWFTRNYAEPLADALFNKSFDVGWVWVVLASLVAAALVGGLFGLFSRRFVAPPLARAVGLALLSVPALYLVVAVALFLFWAPEFAVKDPLGLPLALVASLLYAAYGMVMVLPVATLPAIAAAIMVERWTRSEPAVPTSTALAEPAGPRP